MSRAAPGRPEQAAVSAGDQSMDPPGEGQA